jgi:hypothetical protein
VRRHVADHPEERLEAGGRHEVERPRPLAVHHERVGDAAGKDDDRSRRGVDHLVASPEAHAAVEHDEHLVLVGVDVHGRRRACRQLLVDDAEAPFRRRGVGEDRKPTTRVPHFVHRLTPLLLGNRIIW